jgi:hypothetical protein
MPAHASLPAGFDILDLGYWYDDGKGGIGYEEPVDSWREDCRENILFDGARVPTVEQAAQAVVDLFPDPEKECQAIQMLSRVLKHSARLASKHQPKIP